MNQLKWSRNSQYCTFKGFPGEHIITTNEFGDCAKNGKNEIRSLEKIKRKLKVFKLNKVIPEHKDNIRLVITQYSPGLYWDCDSLVAIAGNGKSQGLISCTADCPTILFYYQLENEYHSIGFRAITHSGWRSTHLNIAGKTVQKIAEIYGQLALLHNIPEKFAPDKLVCGLWSGICENCFEVGPEFKAIFPGDYNSGKINLSRIIRRQLTAEGILEKNIISSDICPKCTVDLLGNPLFASYRRGDTIFRNALAISA